ncbi:uncharacterized protein LOC134816423 [Bolinopsis microptera]|uniref:uncharacterized protein LOC134816423 n=1 Tax=Bolinopsis microptera TaxID=2820187 RepID=UPI003079C998
MDDKFDAPLLGILQNCGELEPFLEVVLGFLYRKTDFFRPLSSDQSMGFPPGVAREKLLKVYKKYECMGSPATVPRSPPSNNHPPTPPATPGLPSITPRPTVTPNVTAGELLPKPELKQEAMEQIQGDWSTSSWDHHNGGVTEHYAWSQTATDVDLKLVLPNPNIKASDLKIDIKPYNLKVQLKQQSDLQTLLEEKLNSLVKPEESMWSLHKENKPNVAAVIKKEEQSSSPRWNQKFSSLVPRKKASPRDKPQRVRGPAIQWSAETLFNTADEAKAFITRDNKWKFRYSHQTTEGKKVYYQCTQRAKLGCGSLCHVVYHHVGTALLYTNGEPHNHIEYNSILNSNPPPANVAISNLNVQSQVALLQKIVSSASSVCSSANNPSPKQPTQLSPRPREDWTPVTIFQSPADAKTFIEHEGLWKFSYSHATPLGRKVFYDCTQKASEGCPAKVQLFYHAEESTVSYMINGVPHKHTSDAVMVRKRGLPSNVKDAILEAYDSGFTDTKLVSKYLEIRGLEPPTASKIKLFLSKHRPESQKNEAPISMLQWQFAPLNNDEESVMGEVVAKC